MLAIAMAGNCAFAQASPQAPIEETELAPITVSASDGVAMAYDETGVSVTVLNVEELKEEGVVQLGDALTRVPGVFALPNGGINQMGSSNQVIIRGMNDETYTMSIFDGMRLYNASGVGRISANLIGHQTLYGLGGLEVLKGAQGAVYGGGAVGGIVYMTTPKGQGEPSYQTTVEIGSFDTQLGNFTAQGEKDELSYFVSSTYQSSTNDMRLADGSRPAGDAANAGEYTNWTNNIRLDYQLNDTNVVTATYRREDIKFQSPHDSVENSTRSNLATLKWVSNIMDAYKSTLMTGIYDADAIVGTDLTPGVVNGRAFMTNLNLQVEWRHDYKWNEKHKTSGAISWNREETDGSYVNNSTKDDIYGIALEHFYTPITNWENSIALRLDSSDIYDENTTMRLASSYKFNKERSRVFASFSTGYKAPTSLERSNGSFYSEMAAYGSVYKTTYYGNPELKEETSVSFDIGFEQKIAENHKITATYFWQQLSDGIDSVYSYGSSYTESNVNFVNADGIWTVQGLELAMQGEITSAWDTGYTLSFTVTSPKDANDDQLAKTARRVWAADIHTSPTDKFTFGVGVQAASGRVNYNANDPLDSYYTMRAYARYEFSENVALHMRVENITDQDYVTEGSYPVDYLGSGVGIYGGVTVKF